LIYAFVAILIVGLLSSDNKKCSVPDSFCGYIYTGNYTTYVDYLCLTKAKYAAMSFHEYIRDQELAFISKQKMFFVASAPLQQNGHINVSPKGSDSFRVLSPNRVIYMDLVGSGNETSAHLLENGRITFMFCSFDGPPNILRLYGNGQTILPKDEQWEELSASFPARLSNRQIIMADIYLVQNSCGYSVPLYGYAGERDFAQKWEDKKGYEGLEEYKKENNRVSLDGLPTALF
jgi:Pyridoxamine 5'-phosphate oxidase